MGLYAERAGTPVCPYWMNGGGGWGENVVTREAVQANGVQHVIARFLAPSLTLSFGYSLRPGSGRAQDRLP